MLVEHTLFGKVDKIMEARKLLQLEEPEEGYYLAFSGGKDSVVVKSLCERAKVKFDSHYNVTTIDPPEVVYFIREHHKDVIFRYPQKNFFEHLMIKGFPTRRRRWCCSVLKEGGGKGRTVLTGIRKEESPQRSKRQKQESCSKGLNREMLNPIIDWTTEEVWEYIKRYKLKYCKLYDEGFKRLGCILCTMAGDRQRKRELERWPRYTNLFKIYFNRLYEKRKNDYNGFYLEFKNGEEFFNWWITDGNQLNKSKHQQSLFY